MINNFAALSESVMPEAPGPIPVRVLFVSPSDEDWRRFSWIFKHTNWMLYRAKDYVEAAETIRSMPVAVLVTEACLPEGRSWTDLLEFASTPGGVRMIVATAFQDDALWAQVLNMGGYDVLMKPFDRMEVIRVISLAWLNWRDDEQGRLKKEMPAVH